MQCGQHLQFNCLACQQPVVFSVLNAQSRGEVFSCKACEKKYAFDEETKARLEQFEALCLQVHASRDILAHTNVGVTVGPHEVKIPYRLLLSRFTTELTLNIGDQQLHIVFRMEPVHDVEKALVLEKSQ